MCAKGVTKVSLTRATYSAQSTTFKTMYNTIDDIKPFTMNDNSAIVDFSGKRVISCQKWWLIVILSPTTL